MKKIAAYLTAILLLFSALSVAAAGAGTYYLREPGLHITVPEGYYVFTRDVDENDPDLWEMDLFSAGEMKDMLEADNAYLAAFSPDVSYNVQVRAVPSELSYFNSLGETLLMSLSDSWDGMLDSYGLNILSKDLYRHPQTLFLRYFWTQEDRGSTVYGLQYYTVVNCQAISITLFSYAGPVTPAQEQLMLGMVESIRFEGMAEAAPEPTTSSGTVYENPDSGISFTVPDHWEETPLSKKREVIKVKFRHVSDSGSIIMYGFSDLWSMLSVTERALYPRYKFDMSLFSMSDIEEILGCGRDTLTLEYYGGKSYYRYATNVSGLGMTVPMTTWIRIENGYMHMFQFSGYADTAYYADMEKLLDSVRY